MFPKKSETKFELKEHKFELKNKHGNSRSYLVAEESPLYTLYKYCNEEKKDILQLALEKKLITKKELMIIELGIMGKCTVDESEKLCLLHKRLNIPGILKNQFSIYHGKLRSYIAENKDILLLRYFLTISLASKVIVLDDILWQLRGIVNIASDEKFILTVLDICKEIMNGNCREWYQQYALVKVCILKKNTVIFKHAMKLFQRINIHSIEEDRSYLLPEKSVIQDIMETGDIPLLETALETYYKKKVKITLY